MDISCQRTANGALVRLAGRLDATWSEPVSQALANAIRDGAHRIDVDMADVVYVSSAGIRILLASAQQLRGIGGRLVVVRPSEAVRKVLTLAGLAGVLIQAEAPDGPAVAAPASAGGVRQWQKDGIAYEVFPITTGARHKVRCAGSVGSAPGRAGLVEPVTFPVNTVGVGLGAFGSDPQDAAAQCGEFLVAAGAAICLPPDGVSRPDYVLATGEMTPAVAVAAGLVGIGDFAHLVRFEPAEPHGTVPMSRLAAACRDVAGGAWTALVIVAETSCLVGAARHRPAVLVGARPGTNAFDLPGVRDWLTFTAEPAFTNTTCLIVGFLGVPSENGPGALLRPLCADGTLAGHLHAAAFAYRPVRKGLIGLQETVAGLFENEHVSGVLHLVPDWRDLTGIGESRFIRGACWCAPAEPRDGP